jgi:hypothetical protein
MPLHGVLHHELELATVHSACGVLKVDQCQGRAHAVGEGRGSHPVGVVDHDHSDRRLGDAGRARGKAAAAKLAPEGFPSSAWVCAFPKRVPSR